MKEKAKAKEILQKIIPFLGIILMIIIFQVGGEGKLLTKGNINSILNQTVYIAIMAFGAIFVYSHGGMDLSYGGVIGFSVLVAILVANTGVPAGVVFITNILAALVWFVLNGVVSVYLQVSPFITSLCIMYMCRGILNTVCASQKYSIPVELFEFDNQKFKLGMLLGVFIICYILFEKTAIGKDNKAIGGNPAAAKQAGVNVNRTRMIAYIISGITVGIAGFILMARAGSVSTSTGQGMEMNVVTALVLGGVPLSGGSKVKMIGAVVGSFSVILLRNGLIILGVNERVVEGIQGLVLLLLVFGVGWSQIDESIKDQVYKSDYFVGGSYEADYDAGYEIVTSLIDSGCKNIAAIGYEPGITCHDRRWEGMMKAFEDHPEVKKAGEYRGLEFTKAVEDFLAADDSIDGIAITLLGIEYCSEPIKSAGREGQVKIAFCDLSENCQGSLDNGETVCAIGGQYADAVFPFVLIYNALEGNALDKVEVPVNFIVCKSGQEFSDYMTYLHNDGVYAWTTDEVDQLIKSKNKNASSDELLEMGKNYSIEDTIARHGK